MENKQVVIIGAGPAGLSCAYELLKKGGVSVTVLECENFAGGISRTVEYHGNHIDIGGHRFFTKNDRVNSLWEELMPTQGAPAYDDKILKNVKPYEEGGPDPEKTDEVMLIRNRVSRIYFNKKFFDYPISLKPSTFINMGFKRTLQSGFGYLKSVVYKREERSLEDFYVNRFGKTLYRLFFESYTQKLWGVHPSELSADWGAQRVKGLSLKKAIWSAITSPFKKRQREVETSLINQFHYPKFGPGQLFKKMADEVVKMGGKIEYGKKVDKFIRGEDGKISKAICGDKEYIADYFVSSMPVKDLFTSLGEGQTSPEVYRIATELPYRDFITVGLLLNGLKIKNKTKIKTLGNIVPDNWIYVQEREVSMGRIQIFNNWSPYMVDKPSENVWIGLEYFCSEGDDMWNSSDKDFIDMAVSELVKMGIIEGKESVLDATRIKVRKAYPAYFGTYKDFEKVRKELDGIENLFCIGRNGQHRYNNMDHSMLTGLISADYILSGNTDKSALWNVNAEKQYHEEKGGENG
ncbi:MAG: NAD(P)/FAD-dependent oxidoreductase [Clostridia bacterium]|nr:NAD(P)/FAD-dependent oxidoreductase [Clostridia bacterium]